MALCPIHHCVARQPCAPSVQTDPDVTVMTARSMLWIHAAPGTATASLPWPSSTFLALWDFVPVCRVHQRGALHHCPMSLPLVPCSPAESREELMERAALHGQVGIRHSGLAPQDTVRMESCSCWQPCAVVKEMVAPWVAMAWGMLWWGAGGSAQSAPQNGVLGCSQHPGTALWGEHLSPPLEGCCLLCI